MVVIVCICVRLCVCLFVCLCIRLDEYDGMQHVIYRMGLNKIYTAQNCLLLISIHFNVLFHFITLNFRFRSANSVFFLAVFLFLEIEWKTFFVDFFRHLTKTCIHIIICVNFGYSGWLLRPTLLEL